MSFAEVVRRRIAAIGGRMLEKHLFLTIEKLAIIIAAIIFDCKVNFDSLRS